MAAREKKAHIQITQNETDGLSVSLISLSKDSWGVYSWEHKNFHFLNQQWVVFSQSDWQCYSHFVRAAWRKQLSMAWNSLRGKSCARWIVASAPWKGMVIEPQTLHPSSTSHSSNTGLQQIFWHQIKPSCFILPPTSFWLEKRPHASGIFLHSEPVSCILLELN